MLLHPFLLESNAAILHMQLTVPPVVICCADYDNPLSRTCSTYINCQYEFVRIAIEDPGIR